MVNEIERFIIKSKNESEVHGYLLQIDQTIIFAVQIPIF
jgi:hypothetical protein